MAALDHAHHSLHENPLHESFLQDNDVLSPRGDQTRQRLLHAAMDIFGKQSYDSTSTRNLADAAGVNLSAIPYYFGGKQGLYMAVAEEIAAQLQLRTQPLIEATRQLLAETPTTDRRRLLECLKAFMTSLTQILAGDEVRPSQISFIIHEQLKPSEAFDRIYRQAMQPLHQTLGQLIGRLMDRSPEDTDVILHTHATIGQAVGFIMARSTLLRRLGCRELDADTRAQIIETVAHMSVAAFTKPDNE